MRGQGWKRGLGILLLSSVPAASGDLDAEVRRVAERLAALGWELDLDRVTWERLDDAERAGRWNARRAEEVPEEEANLRVLDRLGCDALRQDFGVPLGWLQPEDLHVVVGVGDRSWYESHADVLAHELVHAVQVQRAPAPPGGYVAGEPTWEHWWTMRLLQEGEAVLASRVFAAHEAGEAPTLDDAAAFDRDWRSGLIRAWPDALYGPGARYLAPLLRSEGPAAVAALFRDPPVSTERILHPDTHGTDVPSAVPAPDLPPELAGLTPVREDCIGEFGLHLFADQAPIGGRAAVARAAIGWDGDRFWLWETGEEEYAAVWRSVWDREEDARQFVEVFRPLLLGSLSRDGRVVTWHAASDPDLDERLWKALRARPVPQPPPDPSGAAATERAESLWESALARATRITDGRWELPLHGFAIALPPGSWITRDRGHLVACVDPGEGTAGVRVWVYAAAGIPRARLDRLDARGAVRTRVAGRPARLMATPAHGPWVAMLHLHIEGSSGVVHVGMEIPAGADPLRVAAVRRALTALEPLER